MVQMYVQFRLTSFSAQERVRRPWTLCPRASSASAARTLINIYSMYNVCAYIYGEIHTSTVVCKSIHVLTVYDSSDSSSDHWREPEHVLLVVVAPVDPCARRY